MYSKEALRAQLVASFSGLCFPICSVQELARELREHGITGVCTGAVCLGPEEMAELFCPRDFLFTNPFQIADLVAARASPDPNGTGPH